MKIHGYNKHLYMMPDDGDGDGSGSGGGNPPPPPPPSDDDTITKKEADAQAAAQRRKHERAQKEMQKKFDVQAAEIEKLKNRPNPPAFPTPPVPPTGGNLPPPPDGGTDPNAGRLEIMEQRFNRKIEEQQTQIDAANATAADEREKRLQLERQQLIDKALGEAGVIPKHLVQARRFFDPQVVWDELDECWMYQNASGNVVSISEGIVYELPDNLKPTKMRGGAGTTGGIPNKKKVAQTLLDAAQKKKTDLQAQMKKEGPKNNLLAQFTRAKNEVIRLEGELAVRN